MAYLVCMFVYLKPLQDSDIPMVSTWLLAPHVKQWFHDSEPWLEELQHRHDTFSFINHFVAYSDGTPIGYCQFYKCNKSGELWPGVCMCHAWSIGYLIGNEQFLGKGYGTELIRCLTAQVWLETDGTEIVVSPEAGNVPSRRALLAAGFQYHPPLDLFWVKRKPAVLFI